MGIMTTRSADGRCLDHGRTCCGTCTPTPTEQTVDWRHGFPAWLAGKHVTVTTNTRQASGTVARASSGRFGQPFVEFDDGSSIDWRDDEHATITLTAKEQ